MIIKWSSYHVYPSNASHRHFSVLATQKVPREALFHLGRPGASSWLFRCLNGFWDTSQLLHRLIFLPKSTRLRVLLVQNLLIQCSFHPILPIVSSSLEVAPHGMVSASNLSHLYLLQLTYSCLKCSLLHKVPQTLLTFLNQFYLPWHFFFTATYCPSLNVVAGLLRSLYWSSFLWAVSCILAFASLRHSFLFQEKLLVLPKLHSSE